MPSTAMSCSKRVPRACGNVHIEYLRPRESVLENIMSYKYEIYFHIQLYWVCAQTTGHLSYVATWQLYGYLSDLNVQRGQ